MQIRLFEPAISETEARVLWVEQSQAVMVALHATAALVGTYYLRPNSLHLGAHVANAGYVVAKGRRAWAFRHRQLGYVDAHVMVHGLVEGPAQ